MTNSEAWEHYKAYTKDIAELSRKLGFAGIAICWPLKTPDGTFSPQTLLALGFFVAFFVADVLQSIFGALLLSWWLRNEEILRWNERHSLNGDYLKPGWLDYPSFSLFLLKVFILLFGFSLLATEI